MQSKMPPNPCHPIPSHPMLRHHSTKHTPMQVPPYPTPITPSHHRTPLNYPYSSLLPTQTVSAQQSTYNSHTTPP